MRTSLLEPLNEISIDIHPASLFIGPLYILEAFRHNADGVLMPGCHIGGCHYIDANLQAEKRYFALKEYLEMLGVEPEKLPPAWMSAAEGEKFASVIKDIAEKTRALCPIDRTGLRYKESERSPT